MSFFGLRAAALAIAIGGLPCLGCTVTTDGGPPPPPPVATGTVTLDWTIDGAKDPNACNQSQATNIDVRVYYSDGGFQGEYVADCGAFATVITLPEGSYTATGELRDAGNNARTTSVNINPFNVVAGSDLNVPLDFPSSSFY